MVDAKSIDETFLVEALGLLDDMRLVRARIEPQRGELAPIARIRGERLHLPERGAAVEDHGADLPINWRSKEPKFDRTPSVLQHLVQVLAIEPGFWTAGSKVALFVDVVAQYHRLDRSLSSHETEGLVETRNGDDERSASDVIESGIGIDILPVLRRQAVGETQDAAAVELVEVLRNLT